jgi:NDP-sugar pyrophosphorylase family protein
VLDPTALTGYDSRPFSLRDVFFALMAQGALTAQVWDGYWTDIGSQAQLDALNDHHRAGM